MLSPEEEVMVPCRCPRCTHLFGAPPPRGTLYKLGVFVTHLLLLVIGCVFVVLIPLNLILVPLWTLLALGVSGALARGADARVYCPECGADATTGLNAREPAAPYATLRAPSRSIAQTRA
jgi:hypothetical protein